MDRARTAADWDHTAKLIAVLYAVNGRSTSADDHHPHKQTSPAGGGGFAAFDRAMSNRKAR